MTTPRTQCAPKITADASVELHWSGVDRPCARVIGTGGKRALAERLCAAIRSGAAFDGEPEICTDVNGRTYVNARLRVMGRRLNADLRRLGY